MDRTELTRPARLEDTDELGRSRGQDERQKSDYGGKGEGRYPCPPSETSKCLQSAVAEDAGHFCPHKSHIGTCLRHGLRLAIVRITGAVPGMNGNHGDKLQRNLSLNKIPLCWIWFTIPFTTAFALLCGEWQLAAVSPDPREKVQGEELNRTPQPERCVNDGKKGVAENVPTNRIGSADTNPPPKGPM